MHSTNKAGHGVNAAVIRTAMERRGFHSVEQLANALGLHRNTVGNYLHGASALPHALSRILDLLELSPDEVFRDTVVRRRVPGHGVAKLVDQIVARRAGMCAVLFGSRARGTEKRYSDYDLGVFDPTGISFRDFSPLMTVVDDFNKGRLEEVQITNLSDADETFLRGIREDLTYLGGSFSAWIELLKKSGVVVYE